VRTVGRIALQLAVFFVAAVGLQLPLRPLLLLPLLGLSSSEAYEALKAAGGVPGWVFALAELWQNGAVLAAALLSVWLVARLVDRRPLADLGLRPDATWPRELLVGLAVGGLVPTTAFVLGLAAGWVTVTGALSSADLGWPFLLALLPYALAVGLGALGQVVAFVAYPAIRLAEGLPRAVWAAPLCCGVLFGLVHGANPGAPALSGLVMFVAGVLLSAAYLATRRAALPLGVLIALNLVEGYVFGFPVSGGTTAHQPSLLTTATGGPELLTGGGYGPEGGLITLLALSLGGLLLLAWSRRSGTARVAAA
jgi:hypothetical protein